MILVFVMPLGFGQWTIREDDTSRSLIAPEHWGFFIWNIPLIMYCCCCCCCWVASVVSNSVQPQRRQPTKLHRPWDSPGKNTGVGCHFLLWCMKVKSEKWKWSHWVVSNSQRPHGLQPPRLLRPWDFPGKNTGVGFHCLLQIIGYEIIKSNKSLNIQEITTYFKCK